MKTEKMKMKIRDHFARNLDCIEGEMVLINKDEYLPTTKAPPAGPAAT